MFDPNYKNYQDNRQLTLYDALKESYKPIKDQENYYKQHGYILDKSLSDRFHQTLYNPNQKKLLYTVAGSRNAFVWLVNDPALAIGQLKSTARYQTAKTALDQAKQKYQPSNTVVSGHSLGGRIASGIGGSGDKILTYNSGHSFNNKVRNNETEYRTRGDWVSMLGSLSQNVKTLSNNSFLLTLMI